MAKNETLTQTQVQQRPAETKLTKGEVVNVYCNLPHGLRLRLFKEHTIQVPVMGGGWREAPEWRPTGDEVVALGTATEVGKLSRALIVNGYAVTKGVSKEFWDAWLEQNKTAPYVLNNCVFAFKDAASGEDCARDLEGERSGLEPMDMDGDPRRPMPRSQLVGAPGVAQESGR